MKYSILCIIKIIFSVRATNFRFIGEIMGVSHNESLTILTATYPNFLKKMRNQYMETYIQAYVSDDENAVAIREKAWEIYRVLGCMALRHELYHRIIYELNNPSYQCKDKSIQYGSLASDIYSKIKDLNPKTNLQAFINTTQNFIESTEFFNKIFQLHDKYKIEAQQHIAGIATAITLLAASICATIIAACIFQAYLFLLLLIPIILCVIPIVKLDESYYRIRNKKEQLSQFMTGLKKTHTELSECVPAFIIPTNELRYLRTNLPFFNNVEIAEKLSKISWNNQPTLETELQEEFNKMLPSNSA